MDRYLALYFIPFVQCQDTLRALRLVSKMFASVIPPHTLSASPLRRLLPNSRLSASVVPSIVPFCSPENSTKLVLHRTVSIVCQHESLVSEIDWSPRTIHVLGYTVMLTLQQEYDRSTSLAVLAIQMNRDRSRDILEFGGLKHVILSMHANVSAGCSSDCHFVLLACRDFSQIRDEHYVSLTRKLARTKRLDYTEQDMHVALEQLARVAIVQTDPSPSSSSSIGTFPGVPVQSAARLNLEPIDHEAGQVAFPGVKLRSRQSLLDGVPLVRKDSASSSGDDDEEESSSTSSEILLYSGDRW